MPYSGRALHVSYPHELDARQLDALGAVRPGTLESNAHTAVGTLLESRLRQGRPRDVPAQPFQTTSVLRADDHACVLFVGRCRRSVPADAPGRRILGVDAVEHQRMEVQVEVQRRAEALDDRDAAALARGLPRSPSQMMSLT